MSVHQFDYDTDSTGFNSKISQNCKRCLENFDTIKFRTIKSSPNLKQQINDTLFSPTKFKEASIFDGIKVKNNSGEDVLLSDLWLDRPVILKVMARLGCGFCKAESRDLSDLKPYLDQLGVGLAAVAFEDTDLKTFLSLGYWEWDIFIDAERKVYKAANLHRKTLKQILYSLKEKRNLSLMKYLIGKGIKNDFKGDIRQLGGTFIIDTDGRILYQFRPSHASTSPDLRELYEIVGGNANDLDPRDFLTYSFSYTQEQSNLLNRNLFNLTKYLKKYGFNTKINKI